MFDNTRIHRIRKKITDQYKKSYGSYRTYYLITEDDHILNVNTTVNIIIKLPYPSLLFKDKVIYININTDKEVQIYYDMDKLWNSYGTNGIFLNSDRNKKCKNIKKFVVLCDGRHWITTFYDIEETRYPHTNSSLYYPNYSYIQNLLG